MALGKPMEYWLVILGTQWVTIISGTLEDAEGNEVGNMLWECSPSFRQIPTISEWVGTPQVDRSVVLNMDENGTATRAYEVY